MLSAMEGILLFAATTEAMMGVLGSSFIALVNCTDWIRSKKLSKIDFILTGLAISRIFTIWLITLDAYSKVFFQNMFMSSDLRKCIYYIWVIIIYLNIWLVTNLNIFYLLKIANFSHSIFLWLKRRTDKVFAFLMGCLIIMWLTSLPLAVKVIKDVKISNTSWVIHLEKSELFISYVFANVYLNLVMLFPFTVSLLSFLLLILSLWRHTRHMQLNATGNKDPTTTAHIRAIKAVISFLALFVAYCLAFLIATSSYFMPETELAVIWGEMIALLYPSSHSFILILGNSKLKQASVRMLCKVKAMLMGRNC
ncbi:Taste receptor type 2 member 104 [Lemmus lemmus]